jgi:aryl-alcohol dehydrogenase
MTTQSLSAVLREASAPYSLETVTVDEPGPGEVLVRIVGAGMCHTDDFGRSGLLGEAFLPAVLGHEGSGVVTTAGPGVTSVSPGDHVVLSFDSCGACLPCLSGIPSNCTSFELLNLSGSRPDGSGSMRDASGAPLTSRWFGQSSFGEYVLATERNVVKVDTSVPLELLGPLGCGIQTGAGVVLNVMRPGPGESLVVFGTGAVGLAAIMAAKISGVSEIVAVDINPGRRDLALELGATRAVDGADPDVVNAVKAGGPGTDFALDTTGIGTVMTNAIGAVRRPGTAVLVGAGLEMLTLHPAFIAGKTVTYVYEGASVPQLFIPKLIDLWTRGVFPFDRLITTYPLEKIDAAEADVKAGTTIKPVLLMAAPADTADARLRRVAP